MKSKIVAIVASSGVWIKHTQGSSHRVMGWALMADGTVRPLYQGSESSPELAVWEHDDVFQGYEFRAQD